MREKPLLISFAILLGLSVGCGRPPQVSSQNRRLIEDFNTAVSAKRADWLEASVKKLEAQHDDHQMSEEEYEAFRAIVEKAKSGDWPGAQSAVLALGHAQRATAEDVERSKASASKVKSKPVKQH